MIDLLILFVTIKTVRNKALREGLQPKEHQLMALGWVLGLEILGFAVAIFGGATGPAVYIFGLTGALVGAWMSHATLDRIIRRYDKTRKPSIE